MARIQEKVGKSGVKRFYVTIRLIGQPTRSGVFDRKTDAKIWAAQVESDIRRGRFLPKTAHSKHTLAESIDRYVEEVLPEKAKTTQESDHSRLDFWRRELGHVTLKHLNYEQLEDIIPAIRASGRGNGDTSIRRHFAVLSHILSMTIRWGWLAISPIPRVRLPQEPKGRVRFLDNEELSRLLEALYKGDNTALYAAVVLSLATGMRRGELLALTWDRVDLDRGHITLTNTKNGSTRGVPLTGEALMVLKDYGRVRRLDTSRVFPSSNGKGGVCFRKPFLRALTKTGIKDFHWHDLRHTCASYLAMSGAQLQTIAEILGHRSLQMTMRYSHLSQAHLRNEAEKMTREIFGEAIIARKEHG